MTSSMRFSSSTSPAVGDRRVTGRSLLLTLHLALLALAAGCGSEQTTTLAPADSNRFAAHAVGTDTTLELVTWNLRNFASDAGSDEVALVAEAIAGLGADVVALQEVESTVVLDDLSVRIGTLTTGAVVYDVYLTPGNDRGEINNGYLVNPARVAVDGVTQIDAAACLSSDNTPLHDRPSQELQARFIAEGQDWPFVVINNHLRSLGGIDTARTRLKRHEQSQSIAARIQALQSGDPTLPVVVTGDLNAFQFSDGYVDVVGLLSGTSVEDANLVNIENSGVPGFDPTNQVDPTLIKPIESLPTGERYSFIFQGNSQALDHALISQSAQPFLVGFSYSRGNADVWENFETDSGNALRSADHDGLIVVLDPAGIPDAVFSDRFEGS